MKKIILFFATISVAGATVKPTLNSAQKNRSVYYKKVSYKRIKNEEEIKKLYEKTKLKYLEYLKKLEEEMRRIINEYESKKEEYEKEIEKLKKALEMERANEEKLRRYCENEIENIKNLYESKINELQESIQIKMQEFQKKEKVSRKTNKKDILEEIMKKKRIMSELKSFDGYVCNKKECVVFINGKPYRKGDIIATSRITDITQEYIEFDNSIKIYFSELVLK